jgi:hypothetical protein
LLDTGANTSAVDKEWAKAFATPSGDDGGKVSEFDFGYTQKDVVFHVQDLSSFSKIQGVPQAGTLGTDFLSEFLVDVDFERGIVRLVKRDAVPQCATSWTGLSSVALSNYSDVPKTDGPRNIPTVAVDLASATAVPCQLDLGTSAVDQETSVSLNNVAFTRLGIPVTKVRTDTFARTGGAVSVPVYRRSDGAPFQIQLPGTTLSVQVVKVQSADSGYPFDSPEPYALGGMPMLRQWHRIIFDPFEKVIRFR